VFMRWFGVSGAAMFAEPAIAEIEKVVCLIHGSIRTGSGSDRPKTQLDPS
jgi:hypothetical protein